MQGDKTYTSNHAKSNSRGTVALSKKSKTIKLPEGNIGTYLYHLAIGRDFLKPYIKSIKLKGRDQ